MKKKLAILLTAIMLVLSLAGCGASGNTAEEGSPNESGNVSNNTSTNEDAQTSKPQETYTIAVAWNAIDATTEKRMKYLEEVVGPTLGIDFIFSEAISDPGSLMTFLENSYAAGADGLLSNVTDGIEQVAARSNELGIYTAFVTSKYVDEIAEIPTYMGITGIDIPKVASAYGDIIKEKFNPEDPANFLIISGGSAMGVTSHREATQSMLQMLKDTYGLTFDQEVSELATLNATTDIPTGSDNVKITIVPGFPNMEGYVSGVSGLLQTGEYDAMVSVYPTTETFSTAIDEVEKALGKNIKTISQVNFGENTKQAFETMDSTGNPTLDGAVLYSGTAQDSYAIVMLYNGITGNVDLIKPDGKAAVFAPGPFVCESAEQYEKLEQIDSKEDMYVYVADEIKNMTKVYNKDLTHEDLVKIVNDFSTEDILSRRGLNN